MNVSVIRTTTIPIVCYYFPLSQKCEGVTWLVASALIVLKLKKCSSSMKPDNEFLGHPRVICVQMHQCDRRIPNNKGILQ